MKAKTIWKVHSVLGLLAGIPLLVIALTGSVLVFKDEINSVLIPETVHVEPSEAGVLPLDERLAILRRELPEHEVVGWAFYNEETRSDFVYVIERGDSEWLHVFQDPYTGAVLSEPATTSSEVMGWVLLLHYTFFADHIGMVICGVLAILLCLLGISGFLVYRKFWRHFFLLRWKASLRALSGDLHKRIGVVSAPVFLILGFTGAIWNLKHVVDEIRAHETGEPHEPIMEGRFYDLDLSFDGLVDTSQERIPSYRVRYIDFPREEESPVTFYGEFAEQNPFRSPYHSWIAFDAETGDPLAHSRINEASPVVQIYDAFTPLHFGTFGGWPSRILWCILGTSPGVLALSGFVVWKKRNRSKQVPSNKCLVKETK